MEKPKTYVDVLEEMVDVFESIVDDIADIQFFPDKTVLMVHAISLYESTRKVLWYARAQAVDEITLEAQHQEDDYPF